MAKKIEVLRGPENENPAVTQTQAQTHTEAPRQTRVGQVVRNRVTHGDKQHGRADRRVRYKYLQEQEREQEGGGRDATLFMEICRVGDQMWGERKEGS